MCFQQESIEEMPAEEVFDLDQHSKLHLLSGGTTVVQHSPPSKTAAGIKGYCYGYDIICC